MNSGLAWPYPPSHQLSMGHYAAHIQSRPSPPCSCHVLLCHPGATEPGPSAPDPPHTPLPSDQGIESGVGAPLTCVSFCSLSSALSQLFHCPSPSPECKLLEPAPPLPQECCVRGTEHRADTPQNVSVESRRSGPWPPLTLSLTPLLIEGGFKNHVSSSGSS